jgi:hypothetical protein
LAKLWWKYFAKCNFYSRSVIWEWQLNPLSGNAPWHATMLYHFTLSNVGWFYSSRDSIATQCMIKPYPLCKSTTFRSSYFNRIILLWNNLPSHIKSSNSCAIFKSKLYTHYFNKLNSDFDVERPRTWKTFCMKCRSSNITCCS